jgi:hypothetical protein
VYLLLEVQAALSLPAFTQLLLEPSIFKEALREHVCTLLSFTIDLHTFSLILRIRLYRQTTET